MSTQGLVLLLCVCGAVNATELFSNGGFESGMQSPWSNFVQDSSGSDAFFITGATTSNLNSFPVAGPASGSFYALSDESGPNTLALYQTFIVPGPGTVNLSFDMFVADESNCGTSTPAPCGPLVDGANPFDSTDPGNQYATVDLLDGAASVLSTSVLQNLYQGVDNTAQIITAVPYTHYSIDITPDVGAGGTFLLRFVVVAGEGPINLGLDNVSADFTSSTPEPGTFWLAGFAMFGILAFCRYRARRRLSISFPPQNREVFQGRTIS